MILKYLSGTRNKCLCLGDENVSIIQYMDFDYARGVLIAEMLLRDTSFNLWKVTYLGDIVSNNELLYTLSWRYCLYIFQFMEGDISWTY